MRVCELCGSAVVKMRTHAIWHSDKGDRMPVRERRSTGYCSDCGVQIAFVDGDWSHGSAPKCNWKRGTPRINWSFCPRCGHRFENTQDNETHRC